MAPGTTRAARSTRSRQPCRFAGVNGSGRPCRFAGVNQSGRQPDGKILAVSELQDGNSHCWFGVYRWLPNGDLDRSFGSGGWVAHDLGVFPMPHTVALQADGKILVGGQIECPGLQLCFGIVRYNPTARSTAASASPG